MKLPEDAKKGDLFWFNESPVRISAWCYLANEKYCFDLEFIEIRIDDTPAVTMVQVPMGFEFYGVEIRRMTPLEEELF